MLETAPSFCIYSDNKKEEANEIEEEKQKRRIEGSGEFSFEKTSIDLMKEDDELCEQPNSPSMYLATGLGIIIDNDNNNNNNKAHDFGDLFMADISEDYCMELLRDFPDHPLLLIKFAEFLQGKGDLQGAEEYYFRAAQAEPEDGEILARYAQLVWELHHDHGRALAYFEIAAQTAPHNSYVLAAFAKFLWETEDEEDHAALPDTIQGNNEENSSHLHPTNVTDTDMDDIGSYYKRMIDDNPCHPIFLKKYAQFLYQSKGDLESAEGYYSRAIVAAPRDSETLSEYATLLWELYHDSDRTLNYLEQALEASPQDSDVLAAYARILWTIDDD
ncbi:hypothetical protein RND81_14G061500 [Saponaria officinalis]|uniref:Uncharacterized protein n=1 Tax=Saponaria officinalis TaxID=3572 RepID=A0AAW1GLF8_SAPOF